MIFLAQQWSEVHEILVFCFLHKTWLPDTTLLKYGLHSFGLIWKFWMIRFKWHLLCDFFISSHEPAITHLSLFATKVHIHPCCHQSIFSIWWVSLRVVNKKHSLMASAVYWFKYWNDLLLQLNRNVINSLNSCWRTYLFHKEFSIPVSLIILSILHCLSCIFQMSNYWTDHLTLMHPMSLSLLSYQLFPIQYLRFGTAIMCLCCHFIMSTKNKIRLDK